MISVRSSTDVIHVGSLVTILIISVLKKVTTTRAHVVLKIGQQLTSAEEMCHIMCRKR